MANFAVQIVVDNVPAPLLWAAAGPVSCCAGLCIGLYFMNPMAFEILMADEDDEDAQNSAIGQPTLQMFVQSVLMSALVCGCVSAYGLDKNVSIGCCGLICAIVGSLTAWYQFQKLHTLGQDIAQEGKKKQKGRLVSRTKKD